MPTGWIAPDRLAEVIVKTIASAFNAKVTPLAERVAGLEARVRLLDGLAVKAVERLDAAEQQPQLRYRGVFASGDHYVPGDTVTWGGSMWVATQATTAKPGEASPESRAWTLAVKAGRDGKPGKDGQDGKPGRDGKTPW